MGLFKKNKVEIQPLHNVDKVLIDLENELGDLRRTMYRLADYVWGSEPLGDGEQRWPAKVATHKELTAILDHLGLELVIKGRDTVVQKKVEPIK